MWLLLWSHYLSSIDSPSFHVLSFRFHHHHPSVSYFHFSMNIYSQPDEIRLKNLFYHLSDLKVRTFNATKIENEKWKTKKRRFSSQVLFDDKNSLLRVKLLTTAFNNTIITAAVATTTTTNNNNNDEKLKQKPLISLLLDSGFSQIRKVAKPRSNYRRSSKYWLIVSERQPMHPPNKSNQFFSFMVQFIITIKTTVLNPFKRTIHLECMQRHTEKDIHASVLASGFSWKNRGGKRNKLDATKTIDIRFMRSSSNERTLKFDAIHILSYHRSTERKKTVWVGLTYTQKSVSPRRNSV